MAWPSNSVFLALRRDGEVIVPRGDTELERGDRLMLLVPAGAASIQEAVTQGSTGAAADDEPSRA